MKKLIQICILFIFAIPAHAVESIEVQALFPGKAMLLIDGETKVLSVGQSFAGVKMISADGKIAVLEIDGEQKNYAAGSGISMSYTKPVHIREQIMADTRGMYRTHGSINGRSAHFLVDTGASAVAMSATDAKNLGIKYRLDGEPAQVSTASGVARAWRVKLDSVKLGQLEQKNVDAVVVDGDYPEHILLGMTFLDRLKVTKETGKMTLEKKISSSAAD
ncbi:MAG: TIGR02281 family clan AA aspartic protease [Gammaproteobacteria bacterium]|nr:TIGR02281 family clan AA aspartic protease [Gammaproteobacteria bacterium]